MKRKIKVLVDGVGGDVGQGILKSLLDIDTSLNLELYASCISDSSSWLYKIKNAYIFPYINDEKFINFLIEFLNKHHIDVYFPTVDSSLIKISKYREYIQEKTGTKIFIDTLSKIEICNDKYLTTCFLRKHHFDVPSSISMDSKELEIFLSSNTFPLILKTKSGNGAKNIFKIESKKSLEPFIGNSEWILQEYLNIENEITSGIYRGKDGEIKGIYTLKRTLKCGSTYHAQRIIDECLEEKLVKIAEKMDMMYLNIQAVYENGKLFPFEFNGRLSGTTGAMRRVFNVPEMYIREYILNEKITASEDKELFFFTRYNEEIIYTQKDRAILKSRSKQDV